jgi:predicted amidohydrolase
LFNPAYFEQGVDLLEEPVPSLDTKNMLGNLRQRPAVESLLIDLRASYLAHIEDKLGSILKWCSARKAHIVVFPEYSVPAEALLLIRTVAMENHLLVAAGTHRVQHTEGKLDIYSQLGLSLKDIPNGSALAPIVHPNGTVTLSAKKARSKWELGSVLNLG